MLNWEYHTTVPLGMQMKRERERGEALNKQSPERKHGRAQKQVLASKFRAETQGQVAFAEAENGSWWGCLLLL